MELMQYRNQLSETVLEPMVSFMEDWDDCDYTKAHVDACGELLMTYLETLAAIDTPTDVVIMEAVKTVVLGLNDLNEQTDYSLIETDARESIWELIQNSAVDCGLSDASDDITERWREW